jgi:hypothetical protein
MLTKLFLAYDFSAMFGAHFMCCNMLPEKLYLDFWQLFSSILWWSMEGVKKSFLVQLAAVKNKDPSDNIDNFTKDQK